jgi:hypothetical protein
MARLLTLLFCLCSLPVLAAAQGIVINEVVYDDAGTDDDNWVELKGPPGASLNGYRVVGINGAGGAEYQPILLTGFSIPADGYFLIAQSGVTQPNADLVTTDVNYQNSPDSIQLQFEGEAAVFTIVDAVGYGLFGANDIFGGEGSAAADQNPGTSLARCPDGNDTNENSLDFILDPNLTPGAANQGVCSVLGACCFTDGTCQDLSEDNCTGQNGTYQGDGTACEPENPCAPIEPTDLTLCQVAEDDPVSGRPVHEGEFVRVQGLSLMESTVWAPNRVEFAITDGQCCTNVFLNGPGNLIVRGDMVEVVGTVGFFNGKTQITTPDLSITVLSQGNPLPDPAPISTFELSVNGEDYESCLIKLQCVTIVGGTWPINVGDEANLTVDDGTGPVTLRIDRDTDIDGNPAPTGPFSAVGIGGQFDSSDPYSSDYQSVMRDINDVLYDDCLPTTGACCFEDGRCEVLTGGECDQVGGVFQGEGTTCAPENPCPQPPPQGACCFEDGTCTLFTEEDCTNAGGNWLGGDTTCAPDNPCPQPPPSAACCVNGDCVVATEAECERAGGVWFPDQPNCEPPFNCPPVSTERNSWGQIKANYR